MEHLELETGSWTATPVLAAKTFYQRLRGNALLPPEHGLLLRSNSVHGFGLHHPMAVVAFDRAGMVIATGVLEPWRVWTRWPAHMTLELPYGWLVPKVGESVSVSPIVTGCPASSTCAPRRSAISEMLRRG